MSALLLGCIAALAWGIHDVLVRVIAPRCVLYPALLSVLIFGALFQIASIMVSGKPPQMLNSFPLQAAALAVVSGAGFVVASLALYKAFFIGPVRLVAPIIASYPILSVGWAVLSGGSVSLIQWGAVMAVIAGVSIVASLSDDANDPDQQAKRRAAILWSLLSALGFAATFALGQAAAQIAPGMSIILWARLAAIFFLVVFIGIIGATYRPPLALLPLLALMGLLDSLALSATLLAGLQPRPEFASVAASMFGMISIIIAWAFLKEKMTPSQWSGVIFAFVGLGILAL
ncbi:MAG: DMT family transporter [Rhodobacteraceae bacterium]|nr:DMT family transporter [Paracoccaceae bacterium]PHR54750.1 MAG: hypothetical protein COA47_14940 [Robiginitomaculum sp.]